jgi:hypothetical protein
MLTFPSTAPVPDLDAGETAGVRNEAAVGPTSTPLQCYNLDTATD